MPQKTIRITGVNGFIASHLARRLAGDHKDKGLGSGSVNNYGYCHRYVQMLLPHPDSLQVAARDHPDCCLHLAGSSSMPYSF